MIAECRGPAAVFAVFASCALIFKIGASVRAKGYPKLGAFELLRVVREYYKGRDVGPVSD